MTSGQEKLRVPCARCTRNIKGVDKSLWTGEAFAQRTFLQRDPWESGKNSVGVKKDIGKASLHWTYIASMSLNVGLEKIISKRLYYQFFLFSTSICISFLLRRRSDGIARRQDPWISSMRRRNPFPITLRQTRTNHHQPYGSCGNPLLALSQWCAPEEAFNTNNKGRKCICQWYLDTI